MKVAISLKENEIVLNSLLHTLEIKGFETSRSSFLYTIWVYGLQDVYFGDNALQLTKEKDFTNFRIDTCDIQYFEVHKEEN